MLAGDLAEALGDGLKAVRSQVRRGKKPVPISLSFSPKKRELQISEARHGLFERAIPASGTHSREAQVDGSWVYTVVSSFQPADLLDLLVDEASFVIVRGTFRATIARIDRPGGEKIVRTELRPNRRHKGKPAGAEQALEPKRPQSKTWDFSAHMAPPTKTK